MTRIRFEDLPSRNTPRNAENLNKLNNVAISPTEPTTGEEVWIKKSNNLFNVNTPVNTSYLNTNGNFVESADKFLYINQKIKASGNITVSWKSVNTTPTIRIAQYKADGTFISKPNIMPYSETSPVTINLDSNTDYIIVSVEHNNIDKVIDLQIVEGDNELPYTPYVDKEIYVKNDNGVYEEFINVEETNLENYSTAEQRIGTWIDGKPLYRKVVSCGTLPNASSKSIAHGIANFDTFTSVRGIAMATNYKYTKTLPSVSGSDLKGTISLEVSETSIFIGTGIDRTEYIKSYVILEYTKN